LTIPIAATLLILAVGTVDTLVRLGKIGVSHPITSSSVPKPAPVAPPMLKQTEMPTPNFAEVVTAQKEEIAKLKTENARLKKAKAPRIVQVLPTPHVATTPISASSKISASDCNDLLGAQQLVDSTARIEKEAQGSDRYFAAQDTANQAAVNLANLRARLCAEEIYYLH
jgi:hypothetical protein